MHKTNLHPLPGIQGNVIQYLLQEMTNVITGVNGQHLSHKTLLSSENEARYGPVTRLCYQVRMGSQGYSHDE